MLHSLSGRICPLYTNDWDLAFWISSTSRPSDSPPQRLSDLFRVRPIETYRSQTGKAVREKRTRRVTGFKSRIYHFPGGSSLHLHRDDLVLIIRCGQRGSPREISRIGRTDQSYDKATSIPVFFMSAMFMFIEEKPLEISNDFMEKISVPFL